jgi:hypothetical protein
MLFSGKSQSFSSPRDLASPLAVPPEANVFQSGLIVNAQTGSVLIFRCALARAREGAPCGIPQTGRSASKVRRDPAVLVHYLVKCAMHYHHHKMARQMASAQGTIVNSF